MPTDAQGLEFQADISPAINYASWQNSVPLLRSLVIRNLGSEVLEGIQLELTCSPAFLRPKLWQIDRILPGDKIEIRDRNVELDPAYLDGLNEAERGVLTLTARSTAVVEKQLADATFDLRLLARDEWGGMSSSGELIAAFVMPNDPAVASILTSAATVLEQHGHAPALDGYQSGDPARAYLLAASIWSAIGGKKLTYANPPKSFETVGQKTRSPQTILEQRLATCLDSSLLFASAIEAVGLNPVLVMTEGHCIAGCWLVEKSHDRLIETDSSELRKAIAAKELITLETTLVTHRPPAKFEQAIKAAARFTKENHENEFVASIDIARARMAQIRPLTSRTSIDSEAPASKPAAELPLAQAPSFDDLPTQTSEERPTTPNGRIDRWQRKLLDLSLRNNLLNFKKRKKTIPILCPNIAQLEDLLASGKKMRLISLPDQNPIGERDIELHQQKNNEDLNQTFAEQALERKEVCCQLETEELASRLTTLYRSVRNDMAEGGTNTLFLAVGFLRWRPDPNDKKTYRAPLLLVPVKLIRQSASSPFKLCLHEDETRFNATLIQLLKKDFDKDLSQFESELPSDGDGVDVPLILSRMRQHVRDIPGFEVINECALSTFSFAKYLMWKDLVDRIDQLKNNRVVKHLIDNPDQVFESASGKIPTPDEIDVRYDPADIYHPLAADSSQLAAVMAASEGHDFILIGPPGTGKSQTIANIIAQCMGTGKSVLFVAEKTAALEVVHRRLKHHGLGDCCVELHSNKAERKRFLEQLGNSWINNRQTHATDWIEVTQRLKIRRDELNSYVAAIHQKQSNGWSAYDAFGISSLGGEREAVQFDWDPATRHDQDAFKNLERSVDELTVNFEAIESETPLPMISMTDWTIAWESRLLEAGQRLAEHSQALQKPLSVFATALGVPQFSDGSLENLNRIKRLSLALSEAVNDDIQFVFDKEFSKYQDAAAKLQTALNALDEAKNAASADYWTSMATIPLDELDLKWREAQASFWPFSWFAKRKLRGLLQTYATTGTANPATDLVAIRAIRKQQTEIESNFLADKVPEWNGVKTDIAPLNRRIEKAQNLRTAILDFGQPTQTTSQLSTAIQPVINGKSQGSLLFDAAAKFLQAFRTFLASKREFEQESGMPIVDAPCQTTCESTIDACQFIKQNRTQLKRWTSWCRAKRDALAIGLSPLAEGLENKTVAPDESLDHFRLSYARWLIPHLVDGNSVLKSFQKHQHENAIEDFRALDDHARELASEQAKKGIIHNLPAVDKVTRNSELGLLRHQMQLKRPSKSIRHVIENMPDHFGKLAPCILMSPLSIAQYLPTNQQLFDVVIFDEASQITTWDAIGAIARGKQTIVVGDPKQLPPTNFFGRSDDDEEDDTLEDHEKDLESILDEAKASGLPTLQLNWHYRSRHESLIAFSNYHYYQNNLITFPAPDSQESGVSFTFLPDTKYDRGKSRTNRKEAEAIVAEAVRRMKLNLELPEDERLTFGVITFNSQQQTLIQDLFDDAQRSVPELDWYFNDARIEPTVVKNLENVQGDERDIMFFSITFGPIENRKDVPLTFGALNRDGGHRRLNVAITRARRELIVFSSFKADQLNADRSKSRGVRDLKYFLEYAEKGPEVLTAAVKGSVGGFDSPFEQAVAEALQAKGWQVVPQVGVSGFRIDLGIVHPHKPGTYLAGVECDGATYHRSAAARDRDKTRQLVLENLGWNILRVWSPDWWYDAKGATETIDEQLNEFLREESDAKNLAADDASQENAPTDDSSATPEASE